MAPSLHSFTSDTSWHANIPLHTEAGMFDMHDSADETFWFRQYAFIHADLQFASLQLASLGAQMCSLNSLVYLGYSVACCSCFCF
jgi:hypothetical protein